MLALAAGCGKANTAASGSGSGSAAPVAGSAAPVAAAPVAATAVTPAPTPVVAAAPAVPAAPTEWKVGDQIQGKWPGDNRWYNGRISKVNDDHTYNIKYDDGDVSQNFKMERIRGRHSGGAAPAGGGGGGGGGGGVKQCLSTQHSCGGVCVNLLEDNNNCGSCGNRCSSNKHCDNHGFCRQPNGDL